MQVNIKLIIIIFGVIFVLSMATLIIIISLAKKGSKKTKRIKVDDGFTKKLIGLYGGKENIEEISVDNGRLKIRVKDIDAVNLPGIKEIAASGVFVTGNIVKTLFKLDSQIIKQSIEHYSL